MGVSIETMPLAREELDRIEALTERGGWHADARQLLRVEAPLPNGSSGEDTGEPSRGADPTRYRLVNLVLQGGGVLGIAHVGFVAGLERAGVRFAGLAGASAGAIVASGIAVIRGHDLTQASTKALLDLVSSVPADEFIDGPRPVRQLIKRLLGGHPPFAPQSWLGWRAAMDRLRRTRGLNPGDAFTEWLAGEFARLGVPTTAALESALDDIAVQLAAATDTEAEAARRGLLTIVTTALPMGMKLRLPAEMDVLDPRYRSASAALIVRSSMAVPAFFEPSVFDLDRTAWSDFVAKRLGQLVPHQDIGAFQEMTRLPCVDGGVVSNLPVDAFERAATGIPTIAVSLINWTGTARRVREDSLTGLGRNLGAVLAAMRHQRDLDAVSRLRESRDDDLRVVAIDTGDKNWLDFTMSDQDMADLFLMGVERARTFLEQGV